jgi:hypothetical protein
MKKAINQPVTTDLVIYGGVYIKLYEVAEVGTIIPQHSHKFSHLHSHPPGRSARLVR